MTIRVLHCLVGEEGRITLSLLVRGEEVNLHLAQGQGPREFKGSALYSGQNWRSPFIRDPDIDLTEEDDTCD